MIWLSRLLTAVEILLLIKAIQRKQAQDTDSSTIKDVSPDASTCETTEPTSNMNSQPTHQRPLFGQPTASSQHISKWWEIMTELKKRLLPATSATASWSMKSRHPKKNHKK